MSGRELELPSRRPTVISRLGASGAREVRDALRIRIRVVRRELGPDLPDYYPEFLTPEDVIDPQVDVMTPERLGHLILERPRRRSGPLRDVHLR